MASNYLAYWLVGFWESSPPALNVVYIVGTSMIAFGLISLAMGKGRGTPLKCDCDEDAPDD